jgi:hypothetical protein
MALSSIWMLLLLFGTSALLVPTFNTLSRAFGDAFGTRFLLYGAKSLDGITRANDMVLFGLGYLVGYPIASASRKFRSSHLIFDHYQLYRLMCVTHEP